MDTALLLVSSGVLDAFNPCHLASLLLFAFFLVWVGKKWETVAKISVRFILVNFLALLCFRIALVDLRLGPITYESFVSCFYSILGAFYIVIAVWLLHDWTLLLRGTSEKMTLIVFLCRFIPGERLAIFLSVLFGIVMAFAEKYWPPSMVLTMAMNDMLLPGKLMSSIGGLAWYQFFQQWLFIAASLLCIIFLKREQLRLMIKSRLSLVCIIMAGFYAALGAGLLYLFFPKLV